ncbi:hypothetical protein BKA64DRAFT_679991 [Cadophora sp. MPI-SDFR-AT-0126]|nr:hypothetical protein BKA64DRAFT_679991 [Leotiomycetes sp. MPI-SDFR-AT-0126]
MVHVFPSHSASGTGLFVILVFVVRTFAQSPWQFDLPKLFPEGYYTINNLSTTNGTTLSVPVIAPLLWQHSGFDQIKSQL